MKKFTKMLKVLVVGSIWTCFFVFLANLAMVKLWSFSIISLNDWRIIGNFWDGGGKIKTGRDFLFLFSLLLIIPLWLWGWVRAMKLNYLELLLAPLEKYNSWVISKYGEDSRVVLKNLGTTIKKESAEDILAQRLKEKEEEIDQEKETSKIRENVFEKISSLKK